MTEFNEGIIGKRRKGTHDDPFKSISVTLPVINSKVTLPEIPSRFEKVKVTGYSTTMYEIEDGELTENLYKVDYTNGVVFFNVIHNNSNLTFTFLGEGVHFFPASSIWLTKSEDDNIQTVVEKFNRVDLDILAQKGRVDEQMRSVPQPSEVVDIRIDKSGNVYNVAKERIDAEQKKIEDAYVGKDGRNYTSLKERFDKKDDEIGDISFLKNKSNLTEAVNFNSDNLGDVSLFKGNGSSLSEKVKNEFDNRGVNVKWFGAKGDGIADDTAAIQNAINSLSSNGGGKVIIPSGNYKCGQITVASNITIEGMGNSSVILPTANILFLAEGSFGEEIPFGDNKAFGDVSIVTTANHNLIINDIVLIKSQRDCLSSDAGDDWKLGYPTSGNHSLYFGEFGRVRSINSPTQVTLASGLIFPSYRIDKSQESSPTARNFSTVQKFNPVSNVVFRNFKIDGQTGARAISIRKGFQCYVENVEQVNAKDGAFIIFEESLLCRAYRSRVIYDAQTDAANLYSRNGFKVISGYECGFVECYGENGSQTFDITYNTGSVPSVYCYVKDSETKGATNNPLTTHGGTYVVQVINNSFVDNKANGIAIRTRSSIITNNRISGTKTVSTYGITLYEGYARDCVVTNNSITGFQNAVEITDGTSEGEQFKWIGAMIAHNTITKCNRGLYFKRNASNTFTGSTGTVFESNILKNMDGTFGKGVHLVPYVAGVTIKNNVMDGANTFNAGVYADANTNDIYIDENMFLNCGTCIWLLDPSDTVVFPTGKNNAYIGDGNIYKSNVTFTIGNNVGLQGVRDHFGSFHPYADGVGTLGWSGRRWNVLYATSATINTSDRKYKKEIQPEALGLEFINKLNPVTFQFIDGESGRNHHGLIAQEVEEVIHDLGITTDEFAPLTKSPITDANGNVTDHIYGMRYGEFTSILIKAIQELNQKINS
jgi:hypothetical protein